MRDTKSLELFGPWSEPTDEVGMPADVTAYAMGTLPSAKSDTKVNCSKSFASKTRAA